MTEKKFKTQVRIEALHAASLLVTNEHAYVGNLLTEAKMLYDWLYDGKDPIIEQVE